MQEERLKPDRVTFVTVTKACASIASLKHGSQVHAHIIKSGLETDVFVGTSLIDMYAKCGNIEHAFQAFNKLPKRNVVSWTVIVAGYARHGHTKHALKLFQQMQHDFVKPNEVTFVTVVNACASLGVMGVGKQIHAHIIKSGFESDVFVGNSLIDMYAKCGSIKHARQVLDKMPKRDVVSWNTIVAGYAQNGQEDEAFKLFWEMQQENVKPNKVTFVSVVKACANLEKAKQIHVHIIKSGFESDAFVGSTLIDMYAKCRSITDARHVFDRIHDPDVVAWTAMVAGYACHGHSEEALKLFQQMQQMHMKPNKVTFISILKACAVLVSLEQGKQIHAQIIMSGFESDVFVASALVDMYAKCGSIEHACQVFEEMSKRDVVAWNTMVVGYAQHGHGKEALKLFWQMQQESVKPNRVTFVSVLKACAGLEALEQGKQIHAHVIKSGFEADDFVENTLVDMYAKCGDMVHARQAFDKISNQDVVSWNAMIGGYSRHGHAEDALRLFQQMQQENAKPDQVTFIGVLKACSSLASLEHGKQIHAYIIKSGSESDIFVGNTLIDMYAKCGSMHHACQVFDDMPKQDVVSWNAMVAGYAQHNHAEDALKLFSQMQWESVKPNDITFAILLKACGSISSLEQGKEIHAHIIECGYESDAFVECALIDMYSKCGRIKYARQVFDNMSNRDAVAWTTMISGYAQHGKGEDALKLVQVMYLEGVKPNRLTFTCLLSACCHAGLLDEGCHYFFSMDQDHGITPAAEHYACMVDLLGRAGCLEEADDFVKNIPFQPSAVIWTALLGACRIHDHVGLAKHAAECILELEPHNTAAFVLLSNIYAASSKWDDKAKVRKLMEDREIKKLPGRTWIEVDHWMHPFVVEGTSHLQTKEIYAELQRLSGQMT